MFAYPLRFIVGGFLAIAIKNISTSFSVDLSTTVKFTFNKRVWKSSPTYIDERFNLIVMEKNDFLLEIEQCKLGRG